ncbi:MAG: hypothetical protein K2J71_06875, partial [Oscillospiraceae bacterium]|nr:hypothetical protein [Oscillospiraceae bacterium]
YLNMIKFFKIYFFIYYFIAIIAYPEIFCKRFRDFCPVLTEFYKIPGILTAKKRLAKLHGICYNNIVFLFLFLFLEGGDFDVY